MIRVLLTVLLWLPLTVLMAEPKPTTDNQAEQLAEDKVNGYVFDITVQNENQLNAIFKRAEQLQGQFSADQHGRITLVLHGQELRLFQKSNTSSISSSLIEKARQLDQNQLIDIKACQTTMDFYQIEQSELPEFIEQVPLAPVEIERLQREKGYTRL